MAPRDAPAWRRGFDEVERRIGEPLESATNAAPVLEALIRLGRLQRAITGPADQLASHALHLIGLPSGRDVRGLRHQIAALQREVSSLSRQLADTDQSPGED